MNKTKYRIAIGLLIFIVVLPTIIWAINANNQELLQGLTFIGIILLALAIIWCILTIVNYHINK